MGKLSGRARFYKLLTDKESAELLEHQNAVISELPKPPASHVAALPEFLRDQYLSYFRPQSAFGGIQPWLRYRNLADVEEWISALANYLPAILERAARLLEADTMYLRAIDVSK